MLDHQDLKTNNNRRLVGTVVSKPIIYGSTAFYLGKKAEETKTHRWHIYVRGADGEDLSYMISKVAFTLHQSFSNPLRVISQPPFEVSEYGWGEFDCKIQIFFHDEALPPVEVFHFLKLYPPINQPTTTKKPVIHEYYDELVFSSPSEAYYHTLMDGPEISTDTGASRPAHPLAEYFPIYSELPDMQLLERARDWLSNEIGVMKDRFVTAEVECTKRTQELELLVKARGGSCGSSDPTLESATLATVTLGSADADAVGNIQPSPHNAPLTSES